MTRALIALVRLYQNFISPAIHTLTGPSCRFHPTCSQYAIEALKVHGALRGTVYTLWRLARCQPWAKGGNDPVPPRHPRGRSL
jgi:uncharacterized protein